MVTNKEKNNSDLTLKNKRAYWKIGRTLISESIELEVDLESRQILIDTELAEPLNLNPLTLDAFIENYINPSQINSIHEALVEAGKGVEKPIQFNFIHPVFPRPFQLEYSYQITYVSYSKTRLKGRILSVKNSKPQQ